MSARISVIFQVFAPFLLVKIATTSIKVNIRQFLSRYHLFHSNLGRSEHQESRALVASARNSFMKLTEKLQQYFHSTQLTPYTGMRDKNSLIRLLGLGLQKLLHRIPLEQKLHIISSQVRYSGSAETVTPHPARAKTTHHQFTGKILILWYCITGIFCRHWIFRYFCATCDSAKITSFK